MTMPVSNPGSVKFPGLRSGYKTAQERSIQILINTVEPGYNVMKGTEYFVSL
jgi:hypothetical protein